MNRCCDKQFGPECPLRYVCRCLRVTEDVIVRALETEDIRTLKDMRRYTGAGDGCMGCHKRLAAYLERAPLAVAS